MEYTVAQYRDAARRAYEGGDVAAAKRLIAAGRALEARTQAPADGPSVPPAADSPSYATPTAPVTPEHLRDDGQTTLPYQVGSGINEGLASMAGMPVDVATGALNMGARALGLPEIERPIGGSEQIADMLTRGRMIDTTAPQGAGQRIARRVGQDVGASVGFAGGGRVLQAGRQALGPLTGRELTGAVASGVGSGTAGGATAEVTDSPAAQIIASILGGAGAGVLASRGRNAARGVDRAAVEAERDAGYAVLDDTDATLSPQGGRVLDRYVRMRTNAEDIDEVLHPKATRMQGKLKDLGGKPLRKVEQRRQAIGRDVAGAADAGEARMGVVQKGAVDDFLAGIKPQHVQGATQEGLDRINEGLRRGRNATQRLKKHDKIVEALTKAERRAASTGTGGNEINAIRQNIRALLDNPRTRKGFSDAERAQMEKIVRGGTATNAARLVGRLSPSSGALPLAGNLGAASATGGASLAVGAVGEMARNLGEKLTQSQVKRLERMVLSGNLNTSARGLTQAQQNVLAGLIARAETDTEGQE